jgi:hypothetical protein
MPHGLGSPGFTFAMPHGLGSPGFTPSPGMPRADVPVDEHMALILTKHQLAIIPDGVAGAMVEDPPDHTWCNSACVVASTRRDWIAVVTSNDGTHARWNPVLARTFDPQPSLR